jgi:hypothetical protein
MQIETIGKYQLHLIAHELSGKGQWDPFFTILRFDDEKQDFACVVEKRHAGTEPCNSYEDAIDVARRAATRMLEAHKA